MSGNSKMSSDINRTIERYACDPCRTSKVTCSRERSGCARCNRANIHCVYSRYGTIRRKRRSRKVQNDDRSTAEVVPTSQPISADSDAGGNNPVLQSHLTTDIEATRKSLGGIKDSHQSGSLSALSALSDVCSSMYIQDGTSLLNSKRRDFFSFEEHLSEWADLFEHAVKGDAMEFGSPSAETVSCLRQGLPHDVAEPGWLVIYYCFALRNTEVQSVKEKLRHNLWVALSDIRVLLEPSDLNIHAILFVLGQASEFAGPSLCWMLSTSACRMLQALGVEQPHLDSKTREHRKRLFWNLNLLDKGLSIIFGRTPTFHHQTLVKSEQPQLGEALHPRQHRTMTGAPGLFASQFMYQKVLLSITMDDIWDCIYGKSKVNSSKIDETIQALDSWYDQARKVLDATAISEKPFCDLKNSKSIDVAIGGVEFHFLYLTILLTRSSAHMRGRCLEASRKMLHILSSLSPESKEPYQPIIWQLVCCPFTPFLVLFCHIVSERTQYWDQSQESLAAMEELPGYLETMASRNILASKLTSVAATLVQHAKSILNQSELDQLQSRGQVDSGFGLVYNSAADELGQSFLEGLSSSTNPTLPWDLTLGTDPEWIENFGDLSSTLETYAGFDWLSWDTSMQS